MSEKPESFRQSADSQAERLTARLVPVLAAALLGVFVLIGVGFAGSSAIHNAAHDTRHAYGFPCH